MWQTLSLLPWPNGLSANTDFGTLNGRMIRIELPIERGGRTACGHRCSSELRLLLGSVTSSLFRMIHFVHDQVAREFRRKKSWRSKRCDRRNIVPEFAIW
jgi:hypothetical protein